MTNTNKNTIQFFGSFGLRGENLQVLLPHYKEPVPLFSIDKLNTDQAKQLLEALSLHYFQHFFLSKREEEIIFFGGSFNPWHEGHLACLKLIPKQCQKQVLMIPDKNPMKSKNSESISEENPWLKYKNLLEKTSSLAWPLLIYPGFLALPNNLANPTSSWASKLEGPFSFLMGDDSFISLPLWIKPELFLPKTKNIYLVARDEKEEEINKTKDYLSKIAPKLKVIFLGKHPFQHLSSTKLRSMKK